MNLTTLTSLCSSMANDKDQTKFSGLYTQAINLAQQQFSFDSKCCFADNTITVVSGQSQYSLPTDFWLEKKVTHKGLRLAPISRETLEFYIRTVDWTTVKGTPTEYDIDPEEAAKKLTLIPQPGDGDIGANCILTYYFVPGDMSAGTDLPFNSYALLAPYHIAIAEWAAWLLLGYDTATPENIAKKKELLQMYNDKVSEAVDNFANTASEPLRMRGGRYF